MSKKTNVEMILYEKVDIDKLQKLISAEDIDEALRQQLKGYYANRKDDYIPVKYLFSKNLIDKGRLYAQYSLSLQNLKKEIRHTLAKDFYYDIDMVNAHPTLILQYCKDNNIECEHLGRYVTNRDKTLKKIQDAYNIDRNQAKKLVLRLCYLGNYIIEKEDPKTSEIKEFKPKKKLRSLIDFKNELQQIAKEVCKIEKETYQLVKKDKSKINKKSTVLSITAQILEHKCLMAMYKYFQNIKCEVGVLCFDGLMIRKTKLIKNMEKTLTDCSNFIHQKTGYYIKLEEKPMDSILTITLPQYSSYVNSDLECQQKIFQIEGANIFKYCNNKLYIFNEQTGMYENNIETLF
jgi:hypothetical protein